jgi:hypothetical protein
MANSGGRVVDGVGLLPFACCHCRFESRQRRGCLSLVNAVCCAEGHCDGPFPRPGNSYRVCVRAIECD